MAMSYEEYIDFITEGGKRDVPLIVQQKSWEFYNRFTGFTPYVGSTGIPLPAEEGTIQATEAELAAQRAEQQALIDKWNNTSQEAVSVAVLEPVNYNQGGNMFQTAFQTADWYRYGTPQGGTTLPTAPAGWQTAPMPAALQPAAAGPGASGAMGAGALVAMLILGNFMLRRRR